MKKRDWVAASASFYMSLSLIDSDHHARASSSLKTFGWDFAAQNIHILGYFLGAVWFLIAVDYLREKE